MSVLTMLRRARPSNPRKARPVRVAADTVVWVAELRPLAEIHRLRNDPRDQRHTACGLSTIGWQRITGTQAIGQVCQVHCTRCWGPR